MKQFAKTFAVPSGLVLLLALSCSLVSWAQARRETAVDQQKRTANSAEQQPTTEQLRARVEQLMEEQLRSKDRKMKAGWQKAHTAQNGTIFYAYVRDGRVIDSAFGDERMSAILIRIFPNGLVEEATGAGKRPAARHGGNGPTRDECKKRLLDCLRGRRGKILDRYNETTKGVVQNLRAIEPADGGTGGLDTCPGGECKKILGID